MPHQLFYNLNALPMVNTVNYCITARPVIHPDRVMPFHVLVYLVRGEMQIIEDDTVYLLTPDSLIFLKGGIHHWGRKTCPPDTAWYYVHFYLPQETVCPTVELPKESPAIRTYQPEDYNRSLLLPKSLSDIRTGRIAEKLKRLNDLFHSPEPYRIASLGPLLGEILLDCVKTSDFCPSDVPHSDRIRLILSYLAAHLTEPLDTSSLASCVGLSYKYAGELFKRKTGMTLLEYHTVLRMNEAARMLRETGLASAQISERLGYTEPFYFSNVFKKVHKMSPRDYRKMVLGGTTDIS